MDDLNTGAQQRRELAEPSERTQPIPIVVAAVTLAMVVFGAGYILLSEPPGEARLGDRRTVDDLRSASAKPASAVDGAQVYNANCVACHQASGQGLPGVFPPLDGSEWVNGDERVLANILLHGIEGEITVAGKTFKGSMPAFKQLGDAELAAVASYMRSHWSNKSPAITPELVAQERKANPRDKPFAGEAELKTGKAPAQTPPAAQTPPGAQTPPAAQAAAPAQPAPAWAYPSNPPGFKEPPDDGKLRHVPGSSASYTVTQLRDLFISPVWHPKEHPAQPEVVARGRKPEVFACGFCHRADGAGGPENANLMGLPASYIARQMAEFKSGARRTVVPGRNVDNMIKLAKAASDEEIRAAAEYFAAIKPRALVEVREAASVPRTYVTGWHLATLGNGQEEALGQRIIEVPQDKKQFENRDPHARFIAYVPPGSIKKGEALATTGDGKTVPCAVCHGTGLTGAGDIPGIAGRSPSYFVRQLYEFKHGGRTGPQSALMKPVVVQLAIEDMIALAAYVASLPPARAD